MKPRPTDNELCEFHRFLGEVLKNGSAHSSPEEALDEWRGQRAEPGEFDDATEAIQESLDDMANGDRGRPAAEVLADLRQRIESKTGNR